MITNLEKRNLQCALDRIVNIAYAKLQTNLAGTLEKVESLIRDLCCSLWLELKMISQRDLSLRGGLSRFVFFIDWIHI